MGSANTATTSANAVEARIVQDMFGSYHCSAKSHEERHDPDAHASGWGAFKGSPQGIRGWCCELRRLAYSLDRFGVSEQHTGRCAFTALLRVFIDYALPSQWPARWLGGAFGGYYAHCDASRAAR